MGELVNDLLNLARLGRANLVKRNLDMTDLVTAVIDEMRFSTNKLAAKIKLQELKPADCDHTLIKQVWSNLLSNAIKYSKNNPNPQIEIGSIDKSGQIVYYIKDNGVGFDPQYSGKLFGVFQRLHKATDFPGTGVGLAIVYRIITRHGGKVWADAKVNEGAVFYFTLP
jgi:light-regulated signal transduction histidine kinase (bacteriophytochrome)